ncbi:MAG TPA: protein phosphatase 2C domain-containing protein, partial [Paenibacillus sp.]|nr:protein phosphatase 2C domain-containing protein [Paenibacillus sp.]
MLKTAYKTDVGRVRSVNEDRVVVKDGVAGGTLAIVADGMGGHQAGDTASQITIELVESALARIQGEMDDAERKARLVGAIREANAKVFEVASGKEHYRGMGTTITAALADA